MYAIVKSGGKQYRVAPGERLLVERLQAEEGSSVALQPLMVRSEETVLEPQALEQVKVTAKVLAHERGEKLRVFKFKPKRGYKRRTGHRQALTRIEITDIEMGAKRQPRKAAQARSADASSGEASGGEARSGRAGGAGTRAAAAASKEATDGS